MTRNGGEPAAVVGISDHSGWAIFVSVVARDGVPAVVDRRRVVLLEDGLPRQPFHHDATDLDLATAERLIDTVEESARAHARRELSRLRSDLTPQGRLRAIVLRQDPAPAPPDTLAEIVQSHVAMHTADGVLFRRALSDAAAQLGVAATRHRRRREIEDAAHVLGVEVVQIEAFLREAGRQLGPPWRKEHRTAAAAAISWLARQMQLRLGE